MNETLLMIAGLAVVILIIVLYVAARDKETSRKLAMMEAGIDGLNQEIFKLSKAVDSLRKEMAGELAVLETQRDEAALAQIDESRIDEKIMPLARKMATLQERIDRIESDICTRVERLDGQVRKVTFATEHAAPDEQKILQLHAQGLDSATIAKQLRLGKGEVELVLKFSKIHA
jgi:DNA-binding NarL/FixJ family response regulator